MAELFSSTGVLALIVIAAWSGGLIVREIVALALRLPRHSQLGVLGALAGVAPLLGLLGTVVGLVRVFTSGLAPDAVAGGIAEALVTTWLGLIIAIPVLIARQLLLRWHEHRAAAEVLA